MRFADESPVTRPTLGRGVRAVTAEGPGVPELRRLCRTRIGHHAGSHVMSRSQVSRLARTGVVSFALLAAPLAGVSFGQNDAGGRTGGVTVTAQRGADTD